MIAYSTMSQIGYMFLAAGIGAYGYAIFHLMTHAFFKALLFMSAGSSSTTSAGSRTSAAWAASRPRCRERTSFLVGILALVGIPPLAGFWSKDGIISSALATGGGLGWTLYVAGLAGALLTGAYAFRLYYTVFAARRATSSRSTRTSSRARPESPTQDSGRAERLGSHGEGPMSMTVPVGVLTVLSAIGGLLVIPGVWEPFIHWIDESAESRPPDGRRGLPDERARRRPRPGRPLPRARVRSRPTASS